MQVPISQEISYLNHPSSVSLAPSYAILSDSRGSSTDISTVVGIGATAGHLLLALGKRTIKGIDYFYLKSRLTLLGRHFPHDHNIEIKNLEDKYDELLEYANPRFERQEVVQRRALSIIASQMTTGHTGYLIRALERWPSAGIERILEYLLGPGDGYNPEKSTFSFLFHIYSLSGAEIPKLQEAVYCLVLGGLLDQAYRFQTCLSHAHVNHYNFPNKRAPFWVLITPMRYEILGHPREGMNTQLLSEEGAQLAYRGLMWRAIPDRAIHRRIRTISAMWLDTTLPQPSPGFVAGRLSELIEFSDMDEFGDDVSFLAFITFNEIMLDKEQYAELVVMQYLKVLPDTRRCLLLSSFMRRCLSLCQEPMIAPYGFDHHLLRRMVICYWIPLFCSIAKTYETELLLRAGIADFLWTVLALDSSYFDKLDKDMASPGCERLSREIVNSAMQLFLPNFVSRQRKENTSWI